MFHRWRLAIIDECASVIDKVCWCGILMSSLKVLRAKAEFNQQMRRFARSPLMGGELHKNQCVRWETPAFGHWWPGYPNWTGFYLNLVSLPALCGERLFRLFMRVTKGPICKQILSAGTLPYWQPTVRRQSRQYTGSKLRVQIHRNHRRPIGVQRLGCKASFGLTYLAQSARNRDFKTVSSVAGKCHCCFLPLSVMSAL